jgi:hypothetical protein
MQVAGDIILSWFSTRAYGNGAEYLVATNPNSFQKPKVEF